MPPTGQTNRIFIVDAHEDIASNVLHHGRDVRLPVRETRAREQAVPPERGGPQNGQTAMIGVPELQRGGVGLICATIFCMPQDIEVMHEDATAQLHYYQQLASAGEPVRLVRSQDELQALVADFNASKVGASPVGLVLLMEGADPLRTPGELEEWVAQGLRIVGLSWHATRYAGGTHAAGPLTPLGRELLAEMQRLGVILDVSHLAEESFWQALETFEGTVIASHANCRVFTPTDRHLSDEMIQALIGRDAVIGTVLANSFLVGGWTRASGQPVTLDAVVRHIDHICELAGNALHCAIGSDVDGGFGVETTPEEIDSVADFGKIGDALRAHGYSDQDIAGILGGNWLRLLGRALPA